MSEEPHLLFEHVIVATSPVVLAFFSTRDVNALRLTSRLFHEVVSAHRRDESRTTRRQWLYLQQSGKTASLEQRERVCTVTSYTLTRSLLRSRDFAE